MKYCYKCKQTKNKSEFYRNKTKPDGLTTECKICTKKINKARYLANREARKVASREYYEKNKTSVREAGVLYRKENSNEIRVRKKKYYENNKEEILRKKKEYYSKNAELKAASSAEWRKAKATYSGWVSQLPASDRPEMVDGFLTVTCKKCSKRFSPTNTAVQHRIIAYTKEVRAANNLYCSVECKSSCELFNFDTIRRVDPRSKLYIPKTEQEKARVCQTDHLKQLQRDEFGHNYCEKCGEKGEVELHHTQEVAKEGMKAINSAGHILLCGECHKELTKQCK